MDSDFCYEEYPRSAVFTSSVPMSDGGRIERMRDAGKRHVAANWLIRALFVHRSCSLLAVWSGRFAELAAS